MNKHRGIVIDLETLSTKLPKAFVTQAAWSVVDFNSCTLVPVSHNCVRLGDKGQQGRHISMDTVRWWDKQDPAVRHAVFHEGPEVTAEELWTRLNMLFQQDTYKWTIWSMPNMFDIAILNDLFETNGLRPLWDYRQQQDLSTLRDNLDPDRLLAGLVPANPMLHHALYDAEWEALYLCELKRGAMLRNGITDGQLQRGER